jgi:23S rRNA pseudouridine2605 synthase
MARPRKSTGGKTSFGKQSDAEKSFYNRKKSRPERSAGDERPRSKFTRKEGDSESRPSRPTRFGSKPAFGKREDNRDRPGGFSKPFSREGGEGKRPFGKRTGDDRREGGAPFKRAGGFSKSYSRGDSKKPFGKRSFDDKPEGSSPFKRSGGFSKPFSGGEGKRPFGKRGADDDRGEGAPFKRAGGFSKPFSREGGEGKRPFGKRTSDDRREGGAPFKRSGNFSKPFSREGGEEKKPFRKKFDTDKPEGTSRFAKKSFVKRDSSSEERPFKKREEGSFKPREEGGTGYTKRPYVRKSISKSTRALREDKPKSDSDLIRLNKFLANSGAGSRRDADELIRMGLVTVNGETITEMGHKVKITDDVRYEGKKMKAEKPVYILLNKPKGFITTTDDPQDRNTVMGLVAGACKERIYPVGRLDRNTTGLLLLTNDGDLADKLTHPSFNVKKIYKVELDKALTRADFEKIQQGVRLEEGRAIVDDLAYVGDDKKTIGIELHIGWNRIVRRIFESLGYEVIKLDRSVYAGLDKKDLSRGQWRFLKPEEVIQLKHFGK